MTPEVWDDARARIATVAADLGLPVAWPNEDGQTWVAPPVPWLEIEASSAASAPIEIGGGIWREDGTIWLHLMLPLGTGIRDGLVQRKAFSAAFRSDGGALPGAPVGLFYRDHTFDPLGADDGVYRRLSLLIHYDYQDIVTP
jgi:hypothetical protein